MPGKIFINYRRDDARDMAARVRDRLAQTFGEANVFMDVDNLLAGQRFDRELERALDQTDVLLSVIGPQWTKLLGERQAGGERDYVREEIAGALRRGIVVIPVLVEQTPLPRMNALPEDIQDLVLHQKHVVTHERFGRDVGDLVEAIRRGRKEAQAEAVGAGKSVRPVRAIAWALLALVAAVLLYQMGAPDQSVKQREEQTTKSAEAEPLPPVPPGHAFRDCSDCPEMVVVPAGQFLMGSPRGEKGRHDTEGPQHRVTIARPFAVGKFEVTFAEWDACVAGGGCASNPSPSDMGWGRGRRPVINVSWDDAKEYVAWLSRKTSKVYRLLSEAEWEYAARAGTATRYAFGDTISKSQARYGDSGGPAEVGSFPANGFGLHDMHGNAFEWCEDDWRPNYRGAPVDGSVWPGDRVQRILRGGAWIYHPDAARSAARHMELPGIRSQYFSQYFGFRLARTL